MVGGEVDPITMKNGLIGLKIMRKPIQNASKLSNGNFWQINWI